MLSSLQEKVVQLLRWSEKYTKTDMVYLAHGGFWLSSSSILTAGVSFGLALAYANLLPKEAYGTYKYILTIFGVLCVACLRGMDTLVTQAAARSNDGTVIQGLFAKMRWSTLGSIGALIIGLYYLQGGNMPVAIAMFFSAIFIPLMEPFGIFNAVLVGKKDFMRSSILGTAGQFAAGSALFITLLITKDPVVIFVSYCAVWTFTRFLSLLYTLKKYPVNERQEPHVRSYAFHTSVINAMSIFIGSIDSILVYHYLGAAELALYTFAMAPVGHARSILNSPTILATPKLAGQKTGDIGRILYKRSAALFGLGLALTICYCVVAIPFYHIFFSQYVDAIPFSLVYSFTILMQVGNTLVTAVVNSRYTLIPKHLLYLWNIPGIVIALCAMFLIPIFGLWGAIIGQMLSFGSSAIIIWIIWSVIRNKEHKETH